ncbi:No similarity [Planctomycetales bacterium 10988]|nr:No similarity [Planctomycetales bacterium 10988]
MSIARSRARQLAKETVDIIENGFYLNSQGRKVSLASKIEASVAGTVTSPPKASLELPECPVPARRLAFDVRNESSLDAAQRLVRDGVRPMVLNFASAKNPGGGFLNGARAQEESLCRSSALYASINGNEMYAYHRERHDPTYSHYAIYSPDVPVFRLEDGALLDDYFLASFITCPAVNAQVARRRNPQKEEKIKPIMRARIERVLTTAAIQGHEALVLGAWGCGVFGNNTHDIATLFHEALTGPFSGYFSQVTFAVLDWSDEKRFIGPFQRVFEV